MIRAQNREELFWIMGIVVFFVFLGVCDSFPQVHWIKLAQRAIYDAMGIFLWFGLICAAYFITRKLAKDHDWFKSAWTAALIVVIIPLAILLIVSLPPSDDDQEHIPLRQDKAATIFTVSFVSALFGAREGWRLRNTKEKE